MTDPWVCEDCGGPAVWSFGDDDSVVFECRDGCSGLPLDRSVLARYLDKVGSVSGLKRNEAHCG